MGLTLTHEELCTISCNAERVFTDLEDIQSRMNSIGSKVSMEDNNELLVYTYLLRDMVKPNFQNDNYASILSNKDIYKIHNRVLSIESNIKRQVL